jgi:hypothetical protein
VTKTTSKVVSVAYQNKGILISFHLQKKDLDFIAFLKS